RAQRGVEVVAGLVVDAGVEAELVLDEAALLAAAGDADHAAAHDLADLPDDLADRARRGRHHDGLARPGLADLEQAEVRGHAGHPDRAVGGRYGPRGGIALARRGGAADRILLPAQSILDGVADREARVAGLHHLADGAAGHHLAEADRRGIRGGVAHAAALVGI